MLLSKWNYQKRVYEPYICEDDAEWLYKYL